MEKTRMEEYYDKVMENVRGLDGENVAKHDISKLEMLWTQMKDKIKTWKTNYANEAKLHGGLSENLSMAWLTIQTIVQ